MHRRALLLSGGLAVAGAFAGCSDDSPVSDSPASDAAEDDTADQRDGESTETPDSEPPLASWTFDYDRPSEVVTILHTGGDTVTAAEIYVVGAGIVDPDGSDPEITQSDTNWASATGESEVTAGQSVTVGLAPDSEIDLVWRSRGGGTSAIIGEYDS